jgi:hypothetical protein
MINDVPRKLEALRKLQKFYADRKTQPSRVFAKGDKVLVEKRKGEWYAGTVNVFADFPRSLLMQDDTNNRVYQQNTKHVKKTNTTIKRKAQKTMNWKTDENGCEDKVSRRDTQPNATQQTPITEEQRVEPNQQVDLSVPTRTDRAVYTRSVRVVKPKDILNL